MRSSAPCFSVRTVLVVVIASVAFGWFFGANAGSAYALLNYRLWEPLEGPIPFAVPDLSSMGGALGMAGALMASVLWCRHMLRASLQIQGKSLMWRGGLLGVAAGLASTVILHVGLVCIMALDGNRPFKPLFNPVPVAIGILCGIVAGAILGCVGTALCRRELPGTSAGSPADCNSHPVSSPDQAEV